MTTQTNPEKFTQSLVSSGSQFSAPTVSNRSIPVEVLRSFPTKIIHDHLTAPPDRSSR
jgi:hypothetical protein